MAMTAAVVEDDSFTRTMLVTSLLAHGVEVAFDTGTAARALDLATSVVPDVALIDLHLGKGPTGIDVAHALRRMHPLMGVVFLTSFDDPRLLSPSLPNLPGGSQYLTKQSISNMEHLLTAMRAAVEVRTGGSGSPPSSPAAVAARSRAAGGDPGLALTDNQIEILGLVAQGLSNAEIARRRGIGTRSVEVAVARIARSLGLAHDATSNQRVHMARVYFQMLGAKHDGQ
jgi:DNA-binding NarL/FixJ family response regulator